MSSFKISPQKFQIIKISKNSLKTAPDSTKKLLPKIYGVKKKHLTKVKYKKYDNQVNLTQEIYKLKLKTSHQDKILPQQYGKIENKLIQRHSRLQPNKSLTKNKDKIVYNYSYEEKEEDPPRSQTSFTIKKHKSSISQQKVQQTNLCQKKYCICKRKINERRNNRTTFSFQKPKKQQNILSISHRNQKYASEPEEIQKQESLNNINFKNEFERISKKLSKQSDKKITTNAQTQTDKQLPEGNNNKKEVKKQMQQSIYKMFDSVQQRQQNVEEVDKQNYPSEQSSSDSQQKQCQSQLSSSFLIKHIFHKQNTKNNNQNIFSKREKYKLQKKNGLFIIPEDEEYQHFLKDYQPMSNRFTIRQLVQKPNFQAIREEQGVYFGQLENEQKHGQGLMVTEREIYEGKYKHNQFVTGCEKNIDGIFQGQYLNGKRHGSGSFSWYNGQKYEGEWFAGVKEGYGVWKSPKGQSYEGYWKNNRQNGIGYYKHKTSAYKGSFEKSLKHGEGEEIFFNGDRYKGDFKQGKPHGFGRYQWKDGSYYQGQFQKGLRSGKGKWELKNGTVYEGQFKQDFKHGYGIQKQKNGEFYEGQFEKGNRKVYAQKQTKVQFNNKSHLK